MEVRTIIRNVRGKGRDMSNLKFKPKAQIGAVTNKGENI